MSKKGAIAALLITAIMFITGCSSSGESQQPTPPAAESSVQPSASASPYTMGSVTGGARIDKRTTSLAPGQVSYCDLDSAGRAQCARTVLTPSSYAETQKRPRRPISVSPAGWPSSNPEVQVGDGYHGRFWSRTNLLPVSLGGEQIAKNLFTGVRTQEVGLRSSWKGELAHAEESAREYLTSQKDDSCPLYYQVTAVYEGDETIPRMTQIDVLSCDGKIDVHREVYNTAPGWDIDYNTGEIKEKSS